MAKPKCTRLQRMQRVNELLRIRLDGAELYDVREYVHEKQKDPNSCWHNPALTRPLSDATIYRYLRLADDELKKSCRHGRQRMLRLALARRRALYARAVNAGDYRTALACARDEAELLGLYPTPDDALKAAADKLAKTLADSAKKRGP